jgi:hypothetical protein
MVKSFYWLQLLEPGIVWLHWNYCKQQIEAS